MALITCPECNNQCSSMAESCPKCGYPLIAPVSYEIQVVKIRCWGRGQDSINAKLAPYVSAGWEVVTMLEDYWQGGVLSPVYKVTLRRKRKSPSRNQTVDYFKKTATKSNSVEKKACPYCGEIIRSNLCEMCGKENNLFSFSSIPSRNQTVDYLKKAATKSNSVEKKTCPYCGETIRSNSCEMCGKKNNLF